MAKFDKGETVICSCEVKDASGNYKDPATSMKITINQIIPVGQVIVNDTTMTNDTTGKFHYDFNTSSFSAGTYQAKYKATDGVRITIEKETFNLVD